MIPGGMWTEQVYQFIDTKFKREAKSICKTYIAETFYYLIHTYNTLYKHMI